MLTITGENSYNPLYFFVEFVNVAACGFGATALDVRVEVARATRSHCVVPNQSSRLFVLYRYRSIGELIMVHFSKGTKALALAAVVALAAGCASNASVKKAQSTADEALRTAQAAQSAAQAAKSSADAASAKADAAQACCNDVQSKLDRVFERSQRK